MFTLQKWNNAFWMISTFSQFHFSFSWWKWGTDLNWIDTKNTINTFRLYFMMMTIERKLKFWEKKKDAKYMLFFGFERYSIRFHAGCKKSLNRWIFEIQGCVDHESNPFFIYKNRSVPLIGGPCKNMIYFLNLLRTSHRFEQVTMPNMDWICSDFKNETILLNDFQFFSIPFFLVMVKNEEQTWIESTIKIQSMPSDCGLWWWRLKENWNFEKKKRRKIYVIFWIRAL